MSLNNALYAASPIITYIMWQIALIVSAKIAQWHILTPKQVILHRQNVYRKAAMLLWIKNFPFMSF